MAKEKEKQKIEDVMTKEQRIQQLEKEVEQFDYLRMKKQELAQRTQMQLQKDLSDIHDGILTRKGEIICLQRMIAEEKENGPNPS